MNAAHKILRLICDWSQITINETLPATQTRTPKLLPNLGNIPHLGQVAFFRSKAGSRRSLCSLRIPLANSPNKFLDDVMLASWVLLAPRQYSGALQESLRLGQLHGGRHGNRCLLPADLATKAQAKHPNLCQASHGINGICNNFKGTECGKQGLISGRNVPGQTAYFVSKAMT